MKPKLFETGKMPQIKIEACAGDLVVRGWGDPTLLVKGDDADVQETELGVSIVGQGDLVLMVPMMGMLTAVAIAGDLVMERVNGGINIGDVNGDIVLKNTGGAKITAVDGDIVASHGDGSLSIEAVNGDVVINHVQGDVAMGDVNGDVAIQHVVGAVDIHKIDGDATYRHVTGDISLKYGRGDASLRHISGITTVNVDGDVRLHGRLVAGEHSLRAEGNIVMRWPADAGLDLHVIAPEINNRLVFDEELTAENELTARIGDGAAVVSLVANGRVSLKESEIVDKKWGDFAGFGFEFGEQMSDFGTQMSEHFTQFAAEMEHKFGSDFSDKITNQAEKAIAHVERAMEKAMQRTEREAARQQRRAERHQRKSSRHAPPRPPRASSTPEPDHSAEQIKILKMVEKGTITPEQASALLEALKK